MKTQEISWLSMAPLLAILAVHSVAAFAGQHDPARNPGQENAQKTERELWIERISAEPDSNKAFETLRWSADGARVAWMQLTLPGAKDVLKTPQQEIWSPAATTAGQSIRLASAVQVTNALRGTDAPIQPKLDADDDSEGNPFLLQDFAWSHDHASLLLIGSHALAWLDLTSGKSRVLVSGDAALSDVSQSPDGQIISFIQRHGLWLVDAQGGQPRLLAGPAHDDMLEGEPDWLYRNELHLDRGYSWAPDSSHIAYLETDDRPAAKYTLHASNGDERAIVYPRPGGELPILRAFIKPVAGGAAVEMDLGSTHDYYLPRIAWLPDSRRLAIERLNRRQQALDLYIADAATGKARLLLTENDRYWINLSDDLNFLKDGKRFIWSSERSGFRHLYLYDLEGQQLAQLTHGDWEVTHLDAVDEAAQRVYFTATEKTPVERHLYAVNLDGSGTVRLTRQAGTHAVRFAPGAARFADCFSNTTIPPLVSVADTKEVPLTQPQTAQLQTAHTQNGSAAAPEPDGAKIPAAKSTQPAAPLQPVEFLKLKLHLGAEAHAFLIKPPAFDPTHKYPVIVYLAGGPGEQLVRDGWGGPEGLWMQLMAHEGYIIFALDNHGTAGRGHYFEEPIHLRLGAQELVDQRDGLNYLRTLPYVDAKRFGVCGWGYGGFLAIHAMLDRPVAFQAGFAGAPIVDWHFYDAFFPERYLDDPVVHADGWGASMALENRAPNFFKGTLMVAQGSDDEFVLMENILTLQDHLLDAGKSASLLLFPDRGHRIDDLPARRLLFTRMTEFFLNNL